ncbi:MAG: LysO family transporter [Oscillospiraceae bacterium]
MSVIFIMGVGWFVGYKFFKEKYIKANSLFQTICVALLIFCMGISLGNRPTFFDDLSRLGISAVIYAVVPIIFSVILVYFLTELFLTEKGEKTDDNNCND